MPRKAVRKGDTGSQVVSISMPREYPELWEWMAAQKNLSRSIQYLITDAIRVLGPTDIVMSGYRGSVRGPYKKRSKAETGEPDRMSAAPKPAAQPGPEPMEQKQAQAPLPPSPTTRVRNSALDSLLK